MSNVLQSSRQVNKNKFSILRLFSALLPLLFVTLTGSAQTSAEPIEISGGNGASPYQSDLTQWTGSWEAPQTIYDQGVYQNDPQFWSQVNGNDDAGSTWHEGSGGYGILVVDLKQMRTINRFRLFQMMNSDGKTTQIEIFKNTSYTGNTEPSSSSGGWVSVTGGQISVNPATDNGSYLSNPTAINVADFSTRYVKLHLWNDGSQGNQSYIELAGIKAFHYDGGSYSQNYMRGGPSTGIDLRTDLRVYWSFTEDFTADHGGSSYDLTAYGSSGNLPEVTDKDYQLSGEAAKFDRTYEQYLQTNTDVNPQNSDFTYMVRYKVTTNITGSDRYFLLENTRYFGNAYMGISYGLRDQYTNGYSPVPSDDFGEVYTRPNAGGYKRFYADNGSSLGAENGTWHNVIVTYDDASNTFKAYLDGSSAGSLVNSGTYVPSGLVIGGHRDGTGRNFEGYIDEVATWNRKLNSSEISYLQNNQPYLNPKDIELSNDTVSADATSVGTLSAIDGNKADVHSYSLANGIGDGDNGLFSISGSSLSFKNAQSPGTYNCRIKATDDKGYSYEKAFTVEVEPAAITWTGASSTSWSDKSNWSTNSVPASKDSVVIDGNAVFQPSVNVLLLQTVDDLTFINSAAITINNNATLTVNGDINGQGTFAGSGELTFGSGTHSIGNTISANVIVSVPSGATLSTNGNLTLEDGASLLHGKNTSGGSGTVNGNITLKRNGNNQSNVYNYWGTPTANTNVSVLGSNLYYFDVTQATDTTSQGLRDGWQSASGTMQKGEGYISSNAGTVTFSGSPNEGSVQVNVTRTSGSPQIGWNLVSNPYPSGIDAKDFLNNNSGTIAGTVYFWDDDGSGGSGWSSADYGTWNLAGNVGNAANSVKPNGNIGAGQGFFVKATSSGNIEFTNSMRVADNDQFFKQEPNTTTRVWVSVANNQKQGLFNETLVAFTDKASSGKDWGYDAKKFEGNEDISLYSKLNGGNYAIQSFGELEGDKTVELGLKATMNGTYTMKLNRFENLPETAIVVLEDTVTGAKQNLRQDSTYTFSSAGSRIEGRFLLHFYPSVEVASIDESCAVGDGEISLDHAGSNTWDYTIVDSDGQTVASADNWNGSANIDNLEGGSYTLTLNHGNGYTINKALQIDDKSNVNASFSVVDKSVYVGEPVIFQSSITGANQYTWQFEDSSTIGNVAKPQHVFNAAGQHRVTLKAENTNCQDSHSQVIDVQKRATGISDESAGGILINSNGSRIHISKQGGRSEHKRIAVYNIEGEVLIERHTTLENGARVTFHLPDQPSGTYIVKVQDEEELQTRKVMLMRGK